MGQSSSCCCGKDKTPEINVRDVCQNLHCHSKCLSSCCISNAEKHHTRHHTHYHSNHKHGHHHDKKKTTDDDEPKNVKEDSLKIYG